MLRFKKGRGLFYDFMRIYIITQVVWFTVVSPAAG